MKKLLVLLTVLVGIVAFSASAFAQVCTNCKGDVRNVPCVAASQTAACAEFDYDTPSGAATGIGYCVAGSMLAPNNYRAIFHICDCPDPAAFVAGLVLDVRMTILVDGVAGANGAYWSRIGGIPAVIGFATAWSETAACALAAFTTDFGAPAFFAPDGITASTPLATTACTVPAANQTTVMVADSGLGAGLGGYVVNGAEGPYWWIDIPPIRIDPAVIASGALVQVRIELIDHSGLGICPGCSLCDCTITVAQACCSTATTGSLRFPYFTSLTADAYWNGIAINNRTAAAGTATLTAYEQDGGVGTATVSVPANSMFVDLLENMTWAVVSGTLGGSPCYIDVATDYGNPDGFAMMANGDHESMGYLPRKPAAAVGAY